MQIRREQNANGFVLILFLLLRHSATRLNLLWKPLFQNLCKCVHSVTLS